MKKSLNYLPPRAEIRRFAHSTNFLEGFSAEIPIGEYENEGDVEWLD